MRPLIVVSRCLGFDQCRYNGVMIYDEFIDRLKPFVEFRTVCPELAIGLGVPRYPIRIIKGKKGSRLVQPATKRDITDDMNAFSLGFIRTIGPADGFILKSRSPSCGIKDANIFADMDDAIPISKGMGFFSRIVCDLFPNLPIEDETRLKNRKIRDNFLQAVRIALD